MKHTYKIPGEPKGKARVRVVNGHAYTPQETKDYEHAAALRYRLSGGKIIEGPVAVHILAEIGIPKSATKAQRQGMLDGTIKATKKPDADNIAKIILDALNKIAYKDDSAVVQFDVLKVYSEAPGVTVTVESIDTTNN